MPTIKLTAADQITVDEKGVVLFRETISVFEGDVEVSKSYNRSGVFPGSDISGVPANVQAICNAAWTPEVVAAYQSQAK